MCLSRCCAVIASDEWEQALRETDAELSEVCRAFLETDGTISILKRKNR
jgi:uncharacterized membrane protein YcaP (DUF421 family)